MGVDCEIRLPEDVRIRDVADVIGILAGCEKVWSETSDKKATWVNVKCVDVSTVGMVGMAHINVSIPISTKGNDTAFVLYHFEPGTFPDGTCGRLLTPRSTGWWIAVGKRLVDFFGGTVDFNYCDEQDIDYQKPKPRWHNNPEGDEEWDDFQKAKFAVQPLTDAEVETVWEVAAYDKKDA